MNWNMKSQKVLLTASLLALAMSPAISAVAQTRDEKVINDREELIDDDTWYYDNLDAGLAEAQASGKPLMVVLRCIP